MSGKKSAYPNQAKLEDLAPVTAPVVCMRCGLIDDYIVTISGPHLKAICKGCNRYIKFLPQILKQTKNKTMADKIIQLRVDVTKLNKEFFYIGEKGKYADMTLFYNEEQDQYGNNGMIVQNVPKEIYEKEKAAKLPKDQMTRGNILGNAKVWANSGNRESSPGYTGETAKNTSANTESTPQPLADDLPF